MDIPVFHDDQHGTAIVVMAALAKRLETGREDAAGTARGHLGGGAAGTAIAKLLASAGTQRIVRLRPRRGDSQRRTIYADNPVKQWLAENTNPERLRGSLAT